MKLGPDEARRRLVGHDHGILGTVHPERGVDLVPVCFAVDGDHLVVPIDTVKPKATTELRRRDNLDRDPRATLLVEGWDPDDWSRLWWARAELRAVVLDDDAIGRLRDLLRATYEPYRDATFAALLTFEIVRLSGWSASD